jgi:large subunit ribosomal protein L35
MRPGAGTIRNRERTMAKIKMKSHRGARKRFRVTKNGRVVRGRASGSHLQSHKSGKRVRRLRQSALVHKSEEKRIRDLLLA